MDQDHIDSLLERYLHLLHEYTSLREELTTLQTGMYQNIARANFAAERGVRFGQDYYDDRMQASRRLAVSYTSRDEIQEQGGSKGGRSTDLPGGTVASFTVTNPDVASVPSSLNVEDHEASIQPPNHNPDPGAEAEAISAEQDATRPTNTGTSSAPGQLPQAGLDATTEKDAKTSISESPSSSPTANKGRVAIQKSNDPLRWFGLLTPVPLRQAQTQSIRIVEHVIPRLASVSAAMAEVEIEVRRARKRRAKAETAATRPSQQSSHE